MNIVFVSGEFPKKPEAATGGIGTYLLTLTQELVRQGQRVTVITNNVDKHYYSELQVINCFFGQVKKFKIELLNRLKNFINYPLLFSFKVFWKLIRLKDIDIIEGNDFGAELFFYLLFVKKRPPVVIRLHTPSFVIQKYNDEPKTLFYKILGYMERFCLKKADSLYSPTKSLAGIVSRDISRKVSAIIPYPFKPIKLKPAKKENIILYVGKLQIKKGIFNLLSAAREVLDKYPQVNFTFVGPDTLNRGTSVKEQLIKESNRYKIAKKVNILGPVSKATLYSLYSKAKIIVIPSFWENFPNVCLEAMFLSCPVIASDAGGLSEMIRNNISGILYAPLNIKQLSDKINFILENPKIVRKLTYNAKKVIEKLNPVKISNQTIKYYQQVQSLINKK